MHFNIPFISFIRLSITSYSSYSFLIRRKILQLEKLPFPSQIIRTPFHFNIHFPPQIIGINGLLQRTYWWMPSLSKPREARKATRIAAKGEDMNEIVCGIDDAGRGPVLGPMVVAAVAMSRRFAQDLTLEGLKDSKLVSPKRRDKLFDMIQKSAVVCKAVLQSAANIDKMRKKTNLNAIETQMMVKAAQHCFQKIPFRALYIDSMDVKPDRLASFFHPLFPRRVRIVCAHKADSLFPVVSAASIIAKVTRDREMKKLEKAYKAPLGSGYPSDPVTLKFLRAYYKENNSMPKIARTSWSTIAKLQRDFS